MFWKFWRGALCQNLLQQSQDSEYFLCILRGHSLFVSGPLLWHVYKLQCAEGTLFFSTFLWALLLLLIIVFMFCVTHGFLFEGFFVLNGTFLLIENLRLFQRHPTLFGRPLLVNAGWTNPLAWPPSLLYDTGRSSMAIAGECQPWCSHQ